MISSERIQFAKFTPVLYFENIVSIMSMKEKINSNFKILTIFEPITWLFLLISLLSISLVNMKIQKNLLINFIYSLIEHFECLVTKQSKEILI